MTSRQEFWARAAGEADGVAAGLFALLAQPNESERGHDCRGHAVGFRRDDRRGVKCGACGRIIRWIDKQEAS